MLDAIVGSKLRSRVLGWLFTHPDERYFVRQLTKLLNEDSTNLSRELIRLEKAGILVSKKEGRQKYYQANRESPFFNDLHGLIVKTVGIADVLRSALSSCKDKIRVALVFGSFASGNEDKTSDIDVLLVGEISVDEVVMLLAGAEEKLGREINSVVYPVDEFRHKAKEGHHFIKSVLKGEKIFLIGDESELERLA
ncbi:MAG: nucleotidyltransferase domain-containing protein [Dehalococcoidaceae bacterium]|nr:nucleotidyltransferase domain-containing protein [Dehalococcoidaceae bacterium]